MASAGDHGRSRQPDPRLLLNAPSDWIVRFAPLLKEGGRLLDLAAGSGRHARWLAARGFRIVAVDRDAAALKTLDGTPNVETVVADLESGPWPFAAASFDAVVVTNYLWRPLFPSIASALAPGGLLLYETFADGQQTIGRPSRPDFLLRDGELLAAFATLSIVAYENVFLTDPDRFVQRVAALESRAS